MATWIDVYVGDYDAERKSDEQQPDDTHYRVRLYDFTMGELLERLQGVDAGVNYSALSAVGDLEIKRKIYETFVAEVDGFDDLDAVPSEDWWEIARAARDFTSGASRVARPARLGSAPTRARSKAASSATG